MRRQTPPRAKESTCSCPNQDRSYSSIVALCLQYSWSTNRVSFYFSNQMLSSIFFKDKRLVALAWFHPHLGLFQERQLCVHPARQSILVSCQAPTADRRRSGHATLLHCHCKAAQIIWNWTLLGQASASFSWTRPCQSLTPRPPALNADVRQHGDKYRKYFKGYSVSCGAGSQIVVQNNQPLKWKHSFVVYLCFFNFCLSFTACSFSALKKGFHPNKLKK